MTSFDDAHQQVLNTINKMGALLGIESYRLNKQLYESLPTDEAIPHWREIFQSIQKKENVTPVNVLFKDKVSLDDLSLEFDPHLTDDEVLEAEEHRHDIISLVDYILEVYESTIKLIAEKRWLKVHDINIDPVYEVAGGNGVHPPYRFCLN